MFEPGVHGVCAQPEWRCQSYGVCFHLEPPLLCPAHVISLGCSHLWRLMLKRCFAPNTLFLDSDTREKKRLPVSADRRPAGLINGAIEASLTSSFHLRSHPSCGCFHLRRNVDVWLRRSEPEFTRTRRQRGTSFCVGFLFVSRMQRAAGRDGGWAEWAECL